MALLGHSNILSPAILGWQFQCLSRIDQDDDESTTSRPYSIIGSVSVMGEPVSSHCIIITEACPSPAAL